MDFLKILKSFEEFVFEALTWLVLLPRSLARTVFAPLQMTEYAATQLRSESDARFSEAISPPLLLILCVLLAHGFDLAVRTPVHTADGTLADTLLASEQNLLLYRTIAFGIWALVGSVYSLARRRLPVNRESLRLPFYQQCYLVSPFALLISVAVSLMGLATARAVIAGLLLSACAGLWFWLVQAHWIRRHTALPWWRSLVAATLILLAGSVANAAAGYMLVTTHVPG